MSYTKKLLILAGDGIGSEVMAEVRKVINWIGLHRIIDFDVNEGLVGGVAYDTYGTPLSDIDLDKAMSADAVLLGAVGGPQWDNVERAQRPEAGLLKLRKEMDLYANLRPAIVFDALAEASSLKTDLVYGLDLLFVRELTGGVYFGEPKKISVLSDGTKQAVDTQIYSTSEIERVACVAFEMAKKRNNKVHSVEKANVMETGVLWRQTVSDIQNVKYDDVTLEHMYADNCAMQLVRAPKQFDVILTDNLFGDILSDCAAMLTGSLGMLPSASLGEEDHRGIRKALYEPVHGSAPDIAGKGQANPIACILSLAMCLRYSFDMPTEALMLETAIKSILEKGLRTMDIMQAGMTSVSTSQMGDAIISELNKLI